MSARQNCLPGSPEAAVDLAPPRAHRIAGDHPISRDGALLQTGDIVRRGPHGRIEGTVKRTDGRFVLVKWRNRSRLERYHASALFQHRAAKPAPAVCIHQWERRLEPDGRYRMYPAGWNWKCARCGRLAQMAGKI